MSNLHYVLDSDGEPRVEPDLITWAKWFEGAERHLAKTTIKNLVTGREHLVSTVFLGLDHRFRGGDPVLWETMVFGDDDDSMYERRYSSRSEALAGHAEVCREVRARLAASAPLDAPPGPE
jgi:hypothetical protein